MSFCDIWNIGGLAAAASPIPSTPVKSQALVCLVNYSRLARGGGGGTREIPKQLQKK